MQFLIHSEIWSNCVRIAESAELLRLLGLILATCRLFLSRISGFCQARRDQVQFIVERLDMSLQIGR